MSHCTPREMLVAPMWSDMKNTSLNTGMSSQKYKHEGSTVV